MFEMKMFEIEKNIALWNEFHKLPTVIFGMIQKPLWISIENGQVMKQSKSKTKAKILLKICIFGNQ